MTESSSFSELVRFADFPEVVSLAPISELKARLRAEGDAPSRATEAELRALLELYFIDQPANRRAWEAVIGSMASPAGPGRGFLVSGAYGSGKSHMLAALSLLAEHAAAWNHFLRGHPWMRPYARAFGPARSLIAVEIPLDHYRGPAHALESIVFRRIEDELRRRMGDDAPALVDETAYLQAFEKLILPQRSQAFKRFLVEVGEDRDWDNVVAQDRAGALRLARRYAYREGIELTVTRSRAETFARTSEALRAGGIGGLVLLLDELSLFLASKDKRGLDEDAAFLQFLGQQAGASRLWIVAATQRELEQVGDIDAHSLRQIRDRYECHHLSLAQLRTVIERKLVAKPNPRVFAAAAREACAAWGGEMSFGAEELTRTYPFNPLALDAFQGAAESFLSQTRSVVQAVGQAHKSGLLAQDRWRLISADLAFDLAAERLAARPELERLEAAQRFYRENGARILRDAPELVAAGFKALALAVLGGARWTVREIADSLAGSAARGAAGADFYPQVEAALRAMRQRGAYVEVLSQAGDFADQYYLDLSSDLGEALRRQLYELTEALEEGDSRIFEHAAAACREAAFPLALLAHPTQQRCEWMNTIRRVTVERRDLRRLRPEELSRLADTLAAPGTPDSGWLVIADLRDVAGQREAWVDSAGQVGGRWAKALLAWLPRALRDDELEALREHAALCMLAADPTAREGEHGRELAARVAQRLAAQAAAAMGIVRQAYAQGELLRADGRRSDLARLGAGDEWEDTLGAVFDWPLRELFPRFHDIAPRKRLAAKQRSTFIIENFLRPGAAAPPPDSALEEALVAYMEPLHLARRDGGEWTLSVRTSAAASAMLALLPESAAAKWARGPIDRADSPRSPQEGAPVTGVTRFPDCAAQMEKSEWGLTPEMVELVAGALARAGYVAALDGFLKPIPFARVGTPLSDHVVYLVRSALLAADEERQVLALAEALWARGPTDRASFSRLMGARSCRPRGFSGLSTEGPPMEGAPVAAQRLDFESQQGLWRRVCAWAAEMTTLVPELMQRLASLYTALGQGSAEWTESHRALAAAEQLTKAIDPDADPRGGLVAAAVAGAQHLCPHLQNLGPLVEFLNRDADLAVLIWRYLNDARLKTPPPLAGAREELLAMLAQGEAMIQCGTGSQPVQAAGTLESLRHKAEAFLSDYASRYQKHHAETYAAARFRQYADLRRSAEFRALAALAPLNLGEGPADIEARLRAQMERHCAGARLGEALAHQPVCPDCGLVLGEDIALVAPEQILSECRSSLGALLTELGRHHAKLEAALKSEPGKTAQAVRAALALAPDCAPEQALGAFSPAVVEWLAAAFARAQTGARLPIAELAAFLRGKRMTREQALRAFSEWLAAHGAPEQGDSVEFE